MNVETWDVPVVSTWQKSNTLADFTYTENGLEIVLIEEESTRRWVILFEEILGFKVIRDEWSKWSKELIPPDGAFFEIIDSPWLVALGVTDSSLEDTPRHFVICCQRELIEVAGREFTIAAV